MADSMTRSRHFLFLLSMGFDEHGPSVHLLTEIIRRCLDSGHRVSMIVRNRSGSSHNVPDELADYKGLQTIVYYDKPLHKSHLVRRYFEDIHFAIGCSKRYKEAGNDVDAVFLQSCPNPLVALKLSKRHFRKPVLYNVQNIFPKDAWVLGKFDKFKPVYYLFSFLLRKALESADKLVTISQDMKQTLIAEGVPDESIDVIHNWSYSDDPYVISDEDNLFLLDHEEARKAAFRVVFSGNIGAMVDVETIAGAAKQLLPYPDIQFFIIGEGGNKQKLERMADELALSNMHFYPYQPEGYAQHNYSMAHVNLNCLPKGIIWTCMPSKTATMLNCARPMVLSVDADSNYAKVMRSIDKSYVVDAGDVAGVAKSIYDIYINGDTSDSQNAREVFKRYCSKENADQYVKAMESICE